MVGRLRLRAVRLMQQLDNTGTGYRDLIERELAKRLVQAGSAPLAETLSEQRAESTEQTAVAQDFSPGVCKSCGIRNDADARFCKSCGTKLLAILLAVLSFAAPVFAQGGIQMPDAKEMSGIPRPVSDLADGRVSVRLIRGQLSNNIQGHAVEVHAGGKVVTVQTDETGRAEFTGIPAGTPTTAIAVVDGERLESQEFAWPAQGGIRMLLVATEKKEGGGGAPAPVFQPVSGNIVFGDQTRIIIEPGDDGLQVYYLLDVQNSARAPVTPANAVNIDTPTGALSTTVLGGAKEAVARGDRVTLLGPFPPGRTELQIAYRMPVSTGEVTIEQQLPLAVPGLAVLMKKLGDAKMTSPQLPNVQEREFDGERYILAQGPTVAQGAVLTLNISGLPHHSPIPRRITLALALLMLGGGAWAAMKGPSKNPNAARVRQLAGRRDKFFNDLIRLEQQKRAGSIDAARYAERRPALIAQLERVYRDLDAEGGQGAAA
jgi:hypothetical protein